MKCWVEFDGMVELNGWFCSYQKLRKSGSGMLFLGNQHFDQDSGIVTVHLQLGNVYKETIMPVTAGNRVVLLV